MMLLRVEKWNKVEVYVVCYLYSMLLVQPFIVWSCSVCWDPNELELRDKGYGDGD